MHRRAFLRAVGSGGVTGLAGCVGGDGAPNASRSAPPLPRRTPGQLPPSTHRVVSVADQDPDPADDLRAGVAMRRRVVTDDHPAQVVFWLTNEGERRAIQHGDGKGMCHVFSAPVGGRDTRLSSPRGLVLYTADGRVSMGLDRKSPRWTRDWRRGRPMPIKLISCPPLLYTPGYSVTTAYEVWDDFRDSSYMEPGTYRWEAELCVWDDGWGSHGETPEAGESVGTDEDHPPRTVTWGFSLEVVDPDAGGSA